MSFRVADPLFVRATTRPVTADFHLRPGSPALAAGRLTPTPPIRGLDGKPFPTTRSDVGAYQH